MCLARSGRSLLLVSSPQNTATRCTDKVCVPCRVVTREGSQARWAMSCCMRRPLHGSVQSCQRLCRKSLGWKPGRSITQGCEKLLGTSMRILTCRACAASGRSALLNLFGGAVTNCRNHAKPQIHNSRGLCTSQSFLYVANVHCSHNARSQQHVLPMFLIRCHVFHIGYTLHSLRSVPDVVRKDYTREGHVHATSNFPASNLWPRFASVLFHAVASSRDRVV